MSEAEDDCVRPNTTPSEGEEAGAWFWGGGNGCRLQERRLKSLGGSYSIATLHVPSLELAICIKLDRNHRMIGIMEKDWRPSPGNGQGLRRSVVFSNIFLHSYLPFILV
jgi:hypothetical protein